jgi:hypothetical protein
MLKPLLAGLGAALIAGAIVVAAPWASAPPISYETVSGWPMRIYYRNLGQGPEHLSAVGGLPALSVDEPLSTAEIDAYFVKVMDKLQPSPTLVKAGDFARFEIDDPDGLAWASGKMPERTSYFYVFAAIEMPRAAIFDKKWVSELCLVAKTHEPFRRCATHNNVYASN